MTKSRKLIGSMATFPARFGIISETLATIAPQLDRLYLYVNDGFDDLPDLSRLPNVVAMDGRQHAGDMSARGKIFPLKAVKDSIVFTLDDDFIYPPDYVRRNLDLLEKMSGHCVVTTHGGIMPPRVEWYYQRTHVFVSRAAVSGVQTCALAGSGTMCFDQRSLELDYSTLLRETMVDIQISLAARAANLPILVLPRNEEWLRPVPTTGLWEEFRANGLTPHTFLAREVDWSFDIYADILRGALKKAGVTAREIGLDPELEDCLDHGGLPLHWRQSAAGYRHRVQYLQLLARESVVAM